jgi:CRP-like cAMP-binding protein
MGNTKGPYVVQNEILATLPPPAFERLHPHLEFHSLKRNMILHDSGRTADAVHFIEQGGVSRVVTASSSLPTEISLVGKSGFIGISVVLGAQAPSHRTIVQIAGASLRISPQDLRLSMEFAPEIREHLLRYVYCFLGEQAQIILCAARHSLVQRLARWLLLAQDEESGGTIQITHDFLAMMLATWRPNVTDALAKLESIGAVARTRGAIQIVDRSVLISHACGCHRIIQERFRSGWHRKMQKYEHRLD